MIQDTDLLLVNRGGVDYKITMSDLAEYLQVEPVPEPELGYSTTLTTKSVAKKNCQKGDWAGGTTAGWTTELTTASTEPPQFFYRIMKNCQPGNNSFDDYEPASDWIEYDGEVQTIGNVVKVKADWKCFYIEDKAVCGEEVQQLRSNWHEYICWPVVMFPGDVWETEIGKFDEYNVKLTQWDDDNPFETGWIRWSFKCNGRPVNDEEPIENGQPPTAMINFLNGMEINGTVVKAGDVVTAETVYEYGGHQGCTDKPPFTDSSCTVTVTAAPPKSYAVEVTSEPGVDGNHTKILTQAKATLTGYELKEVTRGAAPPKYFYRWEACGDDYVMEPDSQWVEYDGTAQDVEDYTIWYFFRFNIVTKWEYNGQSDTDTTRWGQDVYYPIISTGPPIVRSHKIGSREIDMEMPVIHNSGNNYDHVRCHWTLCAQADTTVLDGIDPVYEVGRPTCPIDTGRGLSDEMGWDGTPEGFKASIPDKNDDNFWSKVENSYDGIKEGELLIIRVWFQPDSNDHAYTLGGCITTAPAAPKVCRVEMTSPPIIDPDTVPKPGRDNTYVYATHAGYELVDCDGNQNAKYEYSWWKKSSGNWWIDKRFGVEGWVEYDGKAKPLDEYSYIYNVESYKIKCRYTHNYTVNEEIESNECLPREAWPWEEHVGMGSCLLHIKDATGPVKFKPQRAGRVFDIDGNNQGECDTMNPGQEFIILVERDLTNFFKGSQSNWNFGEWTTTQGVTHMESVFQDCPNFNGEGMSDWEVTSCDWMYCMFKGASSFNQDLSNWCVYHQITYNQFDSGCTSWEEKNKPGWGTCPPHGIH